MPEAVMPCHVMLFRVTSDAAISTPEPPWKNSSISAHFIRNLCTYFSTCPALPPAVLPPPSEAIIARIVIRLHLLLLRQASIASWPAAKKSRRSPFRTVYWLPRSDRGCYWHLCCATNERYRYITVVALLIETTHAYVPLGLC
jgi:hypothetical protein